MRLCASEYDRISELRRTIGSERNRANLYLVLLPTTLPTTGIPGTILRNRPEPLKMNAVSSPRSQQWSRQLWPKGPQYDIQYANPWFFTRLWNFALSANGIKARSNPNTENDLNR